MKPKTKDELAGAVYIACVNGHWLKVDVEKYDDLLISLHLICPTRGTPRFDYHSTHHPHPGCHKH